MHYLLIVWFQLEISSQLVSFQLNKRITSKKEIWKEMKPLRFNRYVPSALYGIIKTSDYPRKDNLYVIIDLIQRKEIYYKTDLQKKYGF